MLNAASTLQLNEDQLDKLLGKHQHISYKIKKLTNAKPYKIIIIILIFLCFVDIVKNYLQQEKNTGKKYYDDRFYRHNQVSQNINLKAKGI